MRAFFLCLNLTNLKIFKLLCHLFEMYLYICSIKPLKTNTMKTHKAGFTQWRVDVMKKLGLMFEVKNNQIIYKGLLDTTFVNFLIDKRIELGIKPC